MTSSGSPVRREIAAAGLACAALLIAGCGSSSGPAAAPTVTVTKTVTQTAAPSTHPSASSSGQATSPSASGGPQPCATSALKVTTGAPNGAAGSSYYPIEFTNSSGASCTLYGYPGVSFVTGQGGSQIGPAASRNPTSPPTLVTLAAGATAHATLQVADAHNYPSSLCTIINVHWLKIYPPDQFTPLYISFSAQACAGGASATRILSIQTIQPGAT